MITKEARKYWLDSCKARWASGVDNQKIHLLLANLTVDSDTDYSDANGTTHQSLTDDFEDVFSAAATLDGNTAVLEGTAVSWTNTTGSTKTIYGWYIANAAGKLVTAKALVTPIDVPDGVTFDLTPELTLEEAVGGGGPTSITRAGYNLNWTSTDLSATEWATSGAGAVLASSGDGQWAYGDLSSGVVLLYDLNSRKFDMQIPVGKTITGIKVSIRRQSNPAGVARDYKVAILGVAGTSDNKADVATDWPDTFSLAEYGGPGDLWGLSPSVSEVNSPNFGVTIRPEKTGDGDCTIDQVLITLYYS